MSNLMRDKASRVAVRTVAISAGAVLLAGCSFGGLNSLDMPGTSGHGSGAYKIVVQLPDVATLPQNSPVMIDDVTVGIEQADGRHLAGPQSFLPTRLPQHVFRPEDGRRGMIVPLQQRRPPPIDRRPSGKVVS